MANIHLSSGAEQAHPLAIMESVEPVRPVAPYCGGKKRLARTIIEQIDCIPYRCYAEPFVGMGGVFLRRPHKPRAEVVNDFNRDVATFFHILQRHYVQLMDIEQLGAIKGRFILSLNDIPDVRRLFSSFFIASATFQHYP